MKKYAVFMLVIFSIGCLFANGDTENSEFVHKPSELIINSKDEHFVELWEQVQLSKSNQTKEEFDNAYKKFKTEVVPSLSKKRTYMTAAEVEIMKTPATRKSTVSLNDAKYDTDLFFRSLGYGYSVYDFLGGDELFLKMKQEVLNEIERNQINGKVSVDLIVQTLKKVISTYIFDNHFQIEDDHFMDYDGKLVWQYNSGIFFEEDENGYFTTIDDKKYYFDSCDDETAIMVPFLKADGVITNSLVSFHNKYNEGLLSDIVLKNGDNEISVSPNWEKYKDDYYGDATIIAESDGILYLYPGDCGNKDAFLQTGLLKITKRVQTDYKIVILDLRGSNGLGDRTEDAEAFIRNIFGQLPVGNQFTCSVHTGLDNCCYAEPKYESESLHYDGYKLFNKQRKIVENTVPIILLADKTNGCGGEGDVEPFSNADNTLIIGSNTRGVMLAGGDTKRYLPKTGICFSLGIDISLMNPSLENREAIGAVFPDLYAEDSRTLLYSVMSMLVKNGVVDEKTSVDLMNQIKNKRW